MGINTVILVTMLLLGGCAIPPSTGKPALEEGGEVYLYLQPLPREAQKLKFSLDRLSAIGSDGREFPLSLAVREFQNSQVPRQRFIAAGPLAPGQYSGLSFTVTKATLAGEEEEADLLVPQEPVKANFSFAVERKQAVVLSLAFQYAESVRRNFSFSPVFSISVPPLPPSGLAGYACNRDDNTVTVFDKKSGQVMAVIATGKAPESLAFDRKLGRVYVALSGEDGIDVIDTLDRSPRTRIRLNVGDGPAELALAPDGGALVSMNIVSRTVSIIDTRSQVEAGRITVGDGPHALLMDKTGQRCYVFNAFSNTISIIDVPNRALAATISTEPRPLRGQLNRKGDRLYVIHGGSPYLSVIDPVSLSVVKRVYIGLDLGFIKVDPATDMVYLLRKLDNRIEAYDPYTLLLGNVVPADSIDTPSGVGYMTIDSEENNLYLVNSEQNRLTVISLVSKKVVSETDVGEHPTWTTVTGER
ncbi:MAG TPA: hypothetical protein VF903_06900 [Nitrospirota bacterium]